MDYYISVLICNKNLKIEFTIAEGTWQRYNAEIKHINNTKCKLNVHIIHNNNNKMSTKALENIRYCCCESN